MSELCVMDVSYQHIDLIRAACERLGWKLREGGQTRSYYDNQAQNVDYRIEFGGNETILAEKYNIGLRLQEDGSYEVLCDNAMLGPFTPKSQQAGYTPQVLDTLAVNYNYAAVMAQLAMDGTTYSEQTLPDGTIEIIAHQW